MKTPKNKTTISLLLSLRFKSSFIAFLALISGGCATLKIPDIPALSLSECRFRQEYRGLSICIDLYYDEQRVTQYFGKDLMSKGILPVFVVIQNKDSQPIVVRRTMFSLIDRIDNPVQQLLPSMARNPISLAATEGRQGAAISSGIGVLFAPIGLILLGPAMIGLQNQAVQLEEIGRNIQRKALPERILYPSELCQGFLYFNLKEREAIADVKAFDFHIINTYDQEVGVTRGSFRRA